MGGECRCWFASARTYCTHLLSLQALVRSTKGDAWNESLCAGLFPAVFVRLSTGALKCSAGIECLAFVCDDGTTDAQAGTPPDASLQCL